MSRLRLQQEIIDKKNLEILNLKASLAEASQKNLQYKQEDIDLHQKKADKTLNHGVVTTTDKIVSGFAHEINQPLTAINAYTHSCLYIVKNKLIHDKTCDELVRILERITEQTERAGSTVRDMKILMDFRSHSK